MLKIREYHLYLKFVENCIEPKNLNLEQFMRWFKYNCLKYTRNVE